MFEDLNYEELRRRANARLPERVVATLQAHGERRSVVVGERLYGADDRQYAFIYAISATLALLQAALRATATHRRCARSSAIRWPRRARRSY